MIIKLFPLFFGLLLAPVCGAANLLNSNPSFESTNAYLGGRGTFTTIPGWNITGAPTGDFPIVGVSGDQPAVTGRDGSSVAYCFNGSFETRDANRVLVGPGNTYRFTILSESDLAGNTAAVIGIKWYATNSGYSVLSTSSQSITVSNASNFQSFQFSANAPAGAHYASVYLETASTQGALFDHAILELTAGTPPPPPPPPGPTPDGNYVTVNPGFEAAAFSTFSNGNYTFDGWDGNNPLYNQHAVYDGSTANQTTTEGTRRFHMDWGGTLSTLANARAGAVAGQQFELQVDLKSLIRNFPAERLGIRNYIEFFNASGNRIKQVWGPNWLPQVQFTGIDAWETHTVRGVAPAGTSTVRLHEVVDKAVEFSVALPELFDLANRMDHRRVMLAAEASANLRQRGARQPLAEIHGDLPGHRDGFRVVPGLQLAELQLVVVSHVLLDHLDRHGLVVVLEDVSQHILREPERDLPAVIDAKAIRRISEPSSSRMFDLIFPAM